MQQVRDDIQNKVLEGIVKKTQKKNPMTYKVKLDTQWYTNSKIHIQIHQEILQPIKEQLRHETSKR